MSTDFPTLIKKNPGMMFVISYFVIKIVNAIVIYFANMWFPENVVLGTVSLSPLWAILLTSGALSLFTVLMMPFLTQFELMQGRDLKPVEMMVVYFFINFFGLWVLTRFSEVFGMGVTSWLVVAILALFLDIIQGMVMMQIEMQRKK